MVSNFKYNSFKTLDWHGKVPFVAILIVMLIFIVVATAPSLVLFIVFLLYAIAGPVNTFRTVEKVTLEDVIGEPQEDADFEEGSDNKVDRTGKDDSSDKDDSTSKGEETTKDQASNKRKL
jgi:CDP-diacylglycerol--serine O-phosphatidyltransferase